MRTTNDRSFAKRFVNFLKFVLDAYEENLRSNAAGKRWNRQVSRRAAVETCESWCQFPEFQTADCLIE